MTDPDEGGYLIPEEIGRRMYELHSKASPFTMLFPKEPPKPLTRWERLRMEWRSLRWEVRGRLHDWLFPEYRRSDYDYD